MSAMVGAAGTLATQVGSLANSVVITDNLVSPTATAAQNAADAMQNLPNMHTAVAAVVALEKRAAKALAYSNRPQFMIFDGTERPAYSAESARHRGVQVVWPDSPKADPPGGGPLTAAFSLVFWQPS